MSELERRVARLEKDRERSEKGESRTGLYTASMMEALSIGAFCALWARSTRRDPWLWLAAGAAFNVLALLAVWSKHEEDKKRVKTPDPLL